MFGQIVSGMAGGGINDYNEMVHYWQNLGVVEIQLTGKPTDWFTTKIGLETQTYFPLAYGAMDKASYYVQFKGFLPMAEGIFLWDSKYFKDFLPLISSFLCESGLFQYTFNPQVKNLGNYLYRSTAKPLSIQSRLDYPWADLMGARMQLGVLDERLKLEGILNTTYDYPPWYDWNLGFTGSFAPGNKLIDVGAGICFSHLLLANCGKMPDSVNEQWKATKLDARVIMDPKPLIGDFGGMCGPEEWKIYGEVAVLGLKDTQEYPYIPKNSLLHRMPFLAGINLPTFKILDMFSVELEWFKSPYPNDWFGRFDNNLPVSKDFSGDSAAIDNYINKDNFKWSIFLKRSITMFELRCYLANDHSIYKAFKMENFECFEQTLKRPKDWQWFVELRYNL
ncbi:MAG: hypothetical protein JW768_09800 [Chitinispirillaceae bacterium]|nr:hypothetical protein [Chitinispirillaceae bacterium]